jgi:protein SCO1/2
MNHGHIAVKWALVGSMTVAACLVYPRAAPAQRVGQLPEELQQVGVTEHLDTQVPGELEFVDSQGKPVTLGQFFDGRRPLLLTLNYSNCPMLCSLQLNGLFEGLKEMKWDMGREFDMITVSIDPLETPERASLTRQKYLKLYGRPGAAEGYHFLTGKEENIRKLADAVGFHYKFVPQTRQYSHAAVTMVLTPDGRVARYLYGVQYDPQTLRLSLLEASEGQIGSTTDRILLFCFHYDAERGRYGPAAFRLIQVGGGLTVVMLGGAIWILRRREKTKT